MSVPGTMAVGALGVLILWGVLDRIGWAVTRMDQSIHATTSDRWTLGLLVTAQAFVIGVCLFAVGWAILAVVR